MWLDRRCRVVDVPKTPGCYGLRFSPKDCGNCVFRPGCASIRFQTLHPNARVVPTLLPASTHNPDLTSVLSSEKRETKSRVRKAYVGRRAKKAIRATPFENLPQEVQDANSVTRMGRGVVYTHTMLARLFQNAYRETVDGIQYLTGDEVVCTLRKFQRNGYRVRWSGSLLREIRKAQIGFVEFRKTGEQTSKISHRAVANLKAIATLVKEATTVG